MEFRVRGKGRADKTKNKKKKLKDEGAEGIIMKRQLEPFNTLEKALYLATGGRRLQPSCPHAWLTHVCFTKHKKSCI